jgi:UDP-N-acetylmuramoyl-tripeptide--D-alanyl-D-alanine ligase
MMAFTLGDLWSGIGRRDLDHPLAQAVQFTGAVVDSRLAVEGSLFVALKGEREDGHDFVADAFQRGALGALVERKVEGYKMVTSAASLPNSPAPLCILVKNSLKALQDLAAYWRRQNNPRIIAVTGSTGKTTTKETIFSVLKRSFKTLKSEANYNNEIGLPLTLLDMDKDDQKVILEMGMYGLGEIKQLCSISLPQVGVVTNVSHSHLERLGSLKAIAQAKSELVEALSADGVAILNGDDSRVRKMAEKTKARVLFYGLGSDCHIKASHIESLGLGGVHFRLGYEDEILYVKIPLLGRHSVHTALAATAVGLVEGMAWDQIVAGLQDIPAQLRLLVVPGTKGSTIIDDSYNASPASTLAALNLLADLQGRKIAVLGDMLELGSYEEKGHRLVGLRVAGVADKLITVGKRARIIAEEAMNSGMDQDDVHPTDNNSQAVNALRQIVEPGDLILVKGSRGMKMEEIVAKIGRG